MRYILKRGNMTKKAKDYIGLLNLEKKYNDQQLSRVHVIQKKVELSKKKLLKNK